MGVISFITKDSWIPLFSRCLSHSSFTSRDTAEPGIWRVKTCWSNYHLCSSCSIVLLVARYFLWLFDDLFSFFSELLFWIFLNYQYHINKLGIIVCYCLLLQPEGAAIGNYVIQYALALVRVVLLFAVGYSLFDLCFWIY